MSNGDTIANYNSIVSGFVNSLQVFKMSALFLFFFTPSFPSLGTCMFDLNVLG